jgi:hypothetical protein
MQATVLSVFTAIHMVLGSLSGVTEIVAQVRRLERPGVPASFLLATKPVQEELKLSAEQVRKASEAAEKDRQAQEEIASSPVEEGDKRWRELLVESEKTVEAILSPAQLKRFKQLRLQHAGALALADPKLAAELKLTEDQRKAVRASAEDLATKAKRVLADSALTNREIATKLSELTKTADAEVRKRLTADQRAKWEEMIGEPFDWPKP